MAATRLLIRSARRSSVPLRGSICCRCASTSASSPASASTPATAEEKDIVIVGGGIVGLALASALSSKPALSQQYNITLIDVADLNKTRSWTPPKEGEAYENRCSSITNQSKALLQDMGAWEHVDTSRAQGVEQLQIWDGLTDARLDISAPDMPELRSNPAAFGLLPEPMSHMVENANLQRALMQSLQDRSSVSLLSQTKVDSISTTREAGGWPVLQLSDGSAMRARLLIGADGINSPVRKYAGIETHGWMYGTHGLVGTLETEPPLSGDGECRTAFQRFLPTGPCAFLPLPNNKGSLAWATKPELAGAFKKLAPAAQAAFINAAFRLPFSSIQFLNAQMLKGVSSEEFLDLIAWRSSYEVLGPDQTPPLFSELHPPEVVDIHEGTVASFPYRYAHAMQYLGDADPHTGLPNRTALVGDAAHVMHPLAGQGLNAGLGDVGVLSEVLERATTEGADIGLIDSLRSYPRQRYIANQGLMSAVDKLHKLYQREEWPVVWARSTGVEVLNELPWVKRLMMSAGGSSHDKPGQGQGGAPSFAKGAAALAEGVSSAGKMASSMASNARIVAPFLAQRVVQMFKS